ncbi:MAG: PAS domain-containing protein, partial [Planctomycetota bacterium]
PDGTEHFAEWSALRTRGGGKSRIISVGRPLASRTQAERKLAQKQERFSLPFDGISDGVAISEPDAVTGKERLIFCNERYVEISGHTRETLESAQNLDDLLEHHGPPEEAERWEGRANKGMPCSGISSWKHTDGKESFHEWSALRAKQGDKWWVLRVIRQLPDRKAAEVKLRDGAQRLSFPFSDALDSIYIGETEKGRQQLVFCNDRFVQMSGYAREELESADDLGKLLARQDADAGEEVTGEPEADGLPVYGVWSWKRPDGEENFFERSAVCVNVAGRRHMFSVDRDVTEQRQSEEALRLSEERFRILAETAFDGIEIAEVSPAGERTTFCNDRFVQMSGYTREALEGTRDLNKLIKRYFAEQQAEQWHERALEGLPYSSVSAWQRPDGTESLYEWSAVWMEGGGAYRVFEVQREVADGKHLEDLLAGRAEPFYLPFEPASDGVGILELDPDTGSQKPIFFNERLLEMAGHPKVDLLSTENLDDLLVHHGPEERLREQQEGAMHGLPYCGISSWKRADGKENVHEWSAIRMHGGDAWRVLIVCREIVDARELEEKLRGEREWFCLPLDADWEGMRISEPYDRKKLVFCNDRLVEMSGRTCEELEDAYDLNELAVCHCSEIERQAWVEAALKGEPFTGTSSWKRPDGKENYYEWSAIYAQVGDKRRIFSVSRDVTDRVLAERALRESEERFRLLAESSFDGIEICEMLPGEQGRVFATDSYYDVYGHGPGERVDLAPREEAVDWEARVADGLSTWGLLSWKAAGAPRKLVEWSSISVESGEAELHLSIDCELSGREELEAKMHRAGKRMVLPFTALDGCAVHERDPDTGKLRLLLCSNRYAEISGHSREELEGADDLEDLIIHHGDKTERGTWGHLTAEGLPSFGIASWKR